ncbi:hypothetical protein BJL95_02190 [Methylomonas sp. LWB]|uniref:hypothetical protein n=1 Tax=Methylomonas sp. LWB TaxID=1905845 RepID=UPI0008D9B448|nr:hypothetical protein [Methylomonas sp. LWB]OHX36708.1 hypothetical protein BJL95_02190 [Methylomonas sp. LWB]
MSDTAKALQQAVAPAAHPIIYVRGYAMSESERDETAADPFCGFNAGSTVVRAGTGDKDTKARKFIFESPVVRLISDFGYADVYDEGLDIMDRDWPKDKTIPYRSVVVYRYYDDGSSLLGSGKSSPIETYAEGLGKLIQRVRDLARDEAGQAIADTDFKCYLVAHSMGGLVCRAFLQNPALGDAETRAWVDKVFTYATPHNGIELAGVNVPDWLKTADMNNFSRPRMAEYLNLDKDSEYLAEERVDLLRHFPPDRFFCMVGSNRADYNVAAGLSRMFSGHGSDGLVKVANAVLTGQDRAGQTLPCPKAYTYRSHSGYFGIVNSEEAFQNLTRFLFGNLRVDIWFDVAGVTLPESLQGQADQVEADYYFELQAAPRKMRGLLTRRTAEEDSAAIRGHGEIVKHKKRSVYLSSVFLANWAKVDQTDNTLTYAVTLGIGVQEYLVDGWLFDSHVEGARLFSDTAIIAITPAKQIEWHWSQAKSKPTDIRLITQDEHEAVEAGGSLTVEIPIPTIAKKAPGITGKLRFVVSGWR